MKLYYFPLSSYSQKVLMALYEKNIAFDPEIVDLREEAARAEYRKTYPLGKVPLLVLDDGHLIPESSIIIEYLDSHFESGPRLIPKDPELSRRTRFKDRMQDLYLNESVTTLIFESWKPKAERNQEAIERARFRAGVIYDFMDNDLADKRWLMGSEFSLADCAAAPPLFYAQEHFPFHTRRHIAAYWERLSARPSWQKVFKQVEPYLEWAAAAASA